MKTSWHWRQALSNPAETELDGRLKMARPTFVETEIKDALSPVKYF